MPESIPELLHPENPPGPETRLYLKTYDLEPPEAPANSWYIRLGLLREKQRISGKTGCGKRGAEPAETIAVETGNTHGRGDRASGVGIGSTEHTMNTLGGGVPSSGGETGGLPSLEPLLPLRVQPPLNRQPPLRSQPSLRFQPLSDTLPPLGVLVCLPKKGAAKLAYGEDSGRDKGNPADGFKGTVFLVHGYLDHSGSWASVIKRILWEGFVVIALDLPGHGFSGGCRGDIEHFSRYGEAVRRVVKWADKVSLPRPWIAIGHSTGAAAIWMELVRQEEARKRLDAYASGTLSSGRELPAFDNILFLAPLVRSAHWRLSMTLVSLTSWAIPYWKSRTAEDPLFPIPYFPVHWAEKLEEWERTVGDYPILYQKGWILQGTDDDVVDHGYSVPFLRSKLPGFQARYIEGVGHVPYLATPGGERFVREVLEVLRIPRE